ncbi:Pns1-like protein, partial [Globisporangium splendens]
MTKFDDEQEPIRGVQDKRVVHPPQSQVQKSCHDVLFAVAFLIAFGFTVAIAVSYGQDVLTYSVDSQDGSQDGSQDDLADIGDLIRQKHAKYHYAMRICGAIAGGALLASLIWTLAMLFVGKMLIWFSVIAVCAISVATGFLSSNALYQSGDSFYWWPAAVATLFALLVLAYVCCIRSRIAFASANLQIACQAVLSYPVILITALVFTVLQIIWGLVWILATYAAVNHGEYIGEGEEYGAGKKFWILVGMLLVFFWANFVLRNIVTVATAGTVSSWWHHATRDRVPLTSTKALCRALTLSFGSICFGSLVVSIIETIHFLLSSLQKLLAEQGNAIAVCLVGCIDGCVSAIERWVEYFNRFAYAYVGIYGYGFVTSGKHVFDLFASKGWTAITNDSLIVNVLLFGKIAIGFLGGAAGLAAVAYGNPQWTVNVSNPEVALGLSGFLVGYSIANVIMTVIDGAVATVFILFAEDPHSLVFSHPEAHEHLHATWREIYPNEFEHVHHGDQGYGTV